VETSGIEPPTPGLQSARNRVLAGTSKGLTPTPSAACTRACTNKPETANAGTADAEQGNEAERIDPADPLAVIAAVLAGLSPADRGRLAKMLSGKSGMAKG
jgi:hypothetical protein